MTTDSTPVAWAHLFMGQISNLYLTRESAQASLDRLNSEYPHDKGERRLVPLAFADPQWQPIETVPRDNTRVIIYTDGDVRIAWWAEGSMWISVPNALQRVYPKRWSKLPRGFSETERGDEP